MYREVLHGASPACAWCPLQEGLAALPALASLTSLSLSLCKLRDENVEALTTLTGMQRLELGQSTDLAACCLVGSG